MQKQKEEIMALDEDLVLAEDQVCPTCGNTIIVIGPDYDYECAMCGEIWADDEEWDKLNNKRAIKHV